MKWTATVLAMILASGLTLAAGGASCVIEDLSGDWDHCTSRLCADTNDSLEILCRSGWLLLPAESATHIDGLDDSIGSEFETIPIGNFGPGAQTILAPDHTIDECDESPWWCSDLAQFSCGCTGPQCTYDIAPVNSSAYGVGKCVWKCQGWEWQTQTTYCVEDPFIPDHPCNPEDDPTQPVVDCDEP